MAEVTLARLVKKAVSNMSGMTRNLFAGAILALNVIASKAAPLYTCFAALNSCNLGDFSQGSNLGSGTTTHSCGQRGASGRNSCWFSNSAVKYNKRNNDSLQRRSSIMLW